MWEEFDKIEVLNGVETLFFTDNFDNMYKELHKIGIKIKVYNKFNRKFEDAE